MSIEDVDLRTVEVIYNVCSCKHLVHVLQHFSVNLSRKTAVTEHNTRHIFNEEEKFCLIVGFPGLRTLICLNQADLTCWKVDFSLLIDLC